MFIVWAFAPLVLFVVCSVLSRLEPEGLKPGQFNHSATFYECAVICLTEFIKSWPVPHWFLANLSFILLKITENSVDLYKQIKWQPKKKKKKNEQCVILI